MTQIRYQLLKELAFCLQANRKLGSDQKLDAPFRMAVRVIWMFISQLMSLVSYQPFDGYDVVIQKRHMHLSCFISASLKEELRKDLPDDRYSCRLYAKSLNSIFMLWRS